MQIVILELILHLDKVYVHYAHLVLITFIVVVQVYHHVHCVLLVKVLNLVQVHVLIVLLVHIMMFLILPNVRKNDVM